MNNERDDLLKAMIKELGKGGPGSIGKEPVSSDSSEDSGHSEDEENPVLEKGKERLF